MFPERVEAGQNAMWLRWHCAMLFVTSNLVSNKNSDGGLTPHRATKRMCVSCCGFVHRSAICTGAFDDQYVAPRLHSKAWSEHTEPPRLLQAGCLQEIRTITADESRVYRSRNPRIFVSTLSCSPQHGCHDAMSES